MSAITVERPFVKVEKPTTQPANGVCSRNEEFRAALDSYIARYAAEQANRPSVVGSSNNFYALIWLRPLSRLLEAIREIWLFSNELGERPAPVLLRGSPIEELLPRGRSVRTCEPAGPKRMPYKQKKNVS